MSESEKIYKGYKATDKNVKCKGYQFVPGEWHKLDNDDPLELCKNGFHFCVHPSGPWSYYSKPGTRLWKIEAKDVLEGEPVPGTEQKHCSRWIRLVEEIVVDGNRNTGDYNTGHYNTGNRNTGNRNTGNSNTGHYNTGDYNTGHYNTGNRNTGNRNTGNYNTGYYNTGYSNTGDYNTGNCNTGWLNATDSSPDFCSIVPPTVKCFGIETGMTSNCFIDRYQDELHRLYNDITEDCIKKASDYDLPNITQERLDIFVEVYRERMKLAQSAQ